MESREVAAFLELIDKKKYDQAVAELKKVAEGVDIQEHESECTRGVGELRLERSKPFKKLRMFSASDRGIQAVLSLLSLASPEKTEHLIRALKRLCSVPEFAEKVAIGGAAQSLAQFAETLHARLMDPRVHRGLIFNAIWALPALCVALFSNSPHFRRSVISCNLFTHVTRLFPRAAQHYLDSIPSRCEAISQEQFFAGYLQMVLEPVADVAYYFLKPAHVAKETLADEKTGREVGAWFASMFEHLKGSGRAVSRKVPRFEAWWAHCFAEFRQAWSMSHPYFGLEQREFRRHVESLRELLRFLESSKRAELEDLINFDVSKWSNEEPTPLFSSKEPGTSGTVVEQVEKIVRALNGASGSAQKRLLQQLQPLCPGLLLACSKVPIDAQTLDLFKAWAPESLSRSVFLKGGPCSPSSVELLHAVAVLDVVLHGTILVGQATPELCDTVGLRALEWAQATHFPNNGSCGSLPGVLMELLSSCFRFGKRLRSKGGQLLDLIALLLPQLGVAAAGMGDRTVIDGTRGGLHLASVLLGAAKVDTFTRLLEYGVRPTMLPPLRSTLGWLVKDPVVEPFAASNGQSWTGTQEPCSVAALSDSHR